MTSAALYRAALSLHIPPFWDREMLGYVAVDLAEDIDPDRGSVAHALWTMGATAGHDGCRYLDGDFDADYSNECGVCEGYLLAVADRVLSDVSPTVLENRSQR